MEPIPKGIPENLPRREREALRRRLEIIDAAEAVFSEKGFHNSSMDEVARRAEFAVGSLYSFFKNKEDLYAAMLAQRTSEFLPVIAGAMDSRNSPMERIRNLFFARLDIFWSYPRFFKIYFNETMGTRFDKRPALTPEILRQYEEFLVELEAIFREGIRMGEFKGPNARLLVICFEGILHSYATTVALQPDPRRDKREEKALFGMLLQGIQPTT